MRGYRYTPNGLMIELEPEADASTKWLVAATAIAPLFGRTAMLRVNLETGQEEAAGVAG